MVKKIEKPIEEPRSQNWNERARLMLEASLIDVTEASFRLGCDRVTLEKLIAKDPSFPKPIRLTGEPKETRRWLLREFVDYIACKTAQSRQADETKR